MQKKRMYSPLQLHRMGDSADTFRQSNADTDWSALLASTIDFGWFSNLLPIIGDSYSPIYTLILFFLLLPCPPLDVSLMSSKRQNHRFLQWPQGIEGINLLRLQFATKTSACSDPLRSDTFSSFVLEICPTIVNCTQLVFWKKKRQLLVSAWSIIQLTNPKTSFGIVTPIQFKPLKITLSHLMKDIRWLKTVSQSHGLS